MSWNAERAGSRSLPRQSCRLTMTGGSSGRLNPSRFRPCRAWLLKMAEVEWSGRLTGGKIDIASNPGTGNALNARR